jgi:shikimate dehydrogenase
LSARAESSVDGGHATGTRAVNACVIGWPVAHSRSPTIHNYWLKRNGIVGEYRREAVPPGQFAEFVTRLAEHGYVGANVTIPHKEAALAAADADERARAVGAVNTLWLADGRLCGTNTDVEGFIANLDASAPGWDGGLGSALILGAGGAARAVAFGLLDRGLQRIYVANRTLARAEALRERFGAAIRPVPWAELDQVLPEAGLLVNSTSLGMKNQGALDVSLARLPDQAVVADLIYVPLETPLLAAARVRGLRAVDGLGMLLHQAVRGFSLWFGVRPQVTGGLRALVEADLLQA